MNIIVFDNAGTILRRVTALKEISSGNIIFETNTIGIVDDTKSSLILVFQTPTSELVKMDMKIGEYLKDNTDLFELSYSNGNFTNLRLNSCINCSFSIFKIPFY